MANKKYDGVIEAVHYTPDGKVDWVRAYLRRGPTWSDRIILRRQELIEEIKSGRQLMVGNRVEFMAGTFNVTLPVRLSGRDGNEFLVASPSSSAADCDRLEGLPVL